MKQRNNNTIYPTGYRKHNVIPIEGGSVVRVLLSDEPVDWTKVATKQNIIKKIKIPKKFTF